MSVNFFFFFENLKRGLETAHRMLKLIGINPYFGFNLGVDVFKWKYILLLQWQD
jgi:hypothetical protein